jgi:L-ascorbate metabolism protein UlaG (beta-lactamase superfamily)
MKIKVVFLLLAYLGGSALFAQTKTTDKIQTSKGPLLINPVQHATFVLNWNKLTIYVDPTGGAIAFANFKRPDIVLITDIHGDHLDSATLKAVCSSGTKLVVPNAVAELLPTSLKKNLIILRNSEKAEVSKLIITAIPMYNLPESSSAMHTKGRGNGYVIEAGNKIIYISGDTEDIPEMRSLKNIDVAFVCMNLPYTMDINQAASAVLDFKPKIVYPYHYRGKDGLSDVNEFKQMVNSANKMIDVRLLKWY